MMMMMMMIMFIMMMRRQKLGFFYQMKCICFYEKEKEGLFVININSYETFIITHNLSKQKIQTQINEDLISGLRSRKRSFDRKFCEQPINFQLSKLHRMKFEAATTYFIRNSVLSVIFWICPKILLDSFLNQMHGFHKNT